MPHVTLERPPASEYAPYQAGYVASVPEGDIFEILSRQGAQFPDFLRSIGEARGGYRYAPDKWTIKEMIGHVNDTERVFSYRALRFARGDETPLASFDQDRYVPTGNFNARTLNSLADEFGHLRAATVDLYYHLDPDALARRGTASGFVVSVRAMAYVMAGHVVHHERILKERYL
ncbi:MAG TPA: DinB family protein [Gemmatimonadaceae bacterium]|nr:DinB family protein [Gemmatimonadaceae bacterium]